MVSLHDQGIAITPTNSAQVISSVIAIQHQPAKHTTPEHGPYLKQLRMPIGTNLLGLKKFYASYLQT